MDWTDNRLYVPSADWDGRRPLLELEIDSLRARLADAERERDEWRDSAQVVLDENRLLLEALELATVWCRYRRLAGFDTCEDNCSKAYRYQEQCSVYLSTVEPSLIAAEAKRVKGLEAFKEQAGKAVDGCNWIGVRSQCPFYAALAEGEPKEVGE